MSVCDRPYDIELVVFIQCPSVQYCESLQPMGKCSGFVAPRAFFAGCTCDHAIMPFAIARDSTVSAGTCTCARKADETGDWSETCD